MANQLTELTQDRIAYMHAETVVDDVHLVGVYVQGGPVLRALRISNNCPHTLFKRGPRVETTERVIAALNESNRLTRKNFCQSGLAITKRIAAVLTKQRQYADGLTCARAQRTGQDLV